MKYEIVDARISIEAYCNCPYCNSFQDVFDKVRDVLGNDLQVDECDVEITCDECGKVFIVDNVTL